jgi:5-methylcytosine-specific restriction protein A
MYDAWWREQSRLFLRAHPFCQCEECSSSDRPQLAQVVDHKTPHRGDEVLFRDTRNWQSMSKSHHDRKTALEDGGFGRMTLRDALRGEQA